MFSKTLLKTLSCKKLSNDFFVKCFKYFMIFYTFKNSHIHLLKQKILLLKEFLKLKTKLR